MQESAGAGLHRFHALRSGRDDSQQRRTQAERHVSARDLVNAAIPGEFWLRPETATGTEYTTCGSGRSGALSEDAFNISPWMYPVSNSRKPSEQTNRDTAAKAARTKTIVRKKLLFMLART